MTRAGQCGPASHSSRRRSLCTTTLIGAAWLWSRLVSGGSIISGDVFRSVLFSQVRVHSYSKVEWSVLLPEVEVGRRVRLSRVVIDRGCQVPDGIVIGEDAELDAQRFFRTESGITLVTRSMLSALLS